LLSGVRLIVFSHRYSAAVWLALYLALQIGANYISLPVRSPGAFIAVALVSNAMFIFLALAICASLAHAVRDPVRALALLGIGVFGWGLSLKIGLKHDPARLFYTMHELYLVLAAVGLGVLLTNAIREPNILLPAAVFAAFADYFMVHYGTVHVQLTRGAAGQKVIEAMSAHVPRLHNHLPVLTVGMADFVFLAFFFACVFRFDLKFKATFIALFILLTLSLFFVALIGPIPALAPMALGFVAVNFRRFKLSRSELQAMGTAGVIVLVLALAFIFLGRK
jgi:hypothetical protein